MARARGWWPIGVIVSALVVLNVATNRLLADWMYVPVAVLGSAGLVAFAMRVDGRSLEELGMGRSEGRRARWWGVILAGSVLVLYLAAVSLPATRDLFRDERVENWSFARVAFAALIRVPLGTVLLEEVAFRGVLPAVLAARTKVWVAAAVSATLFGLWHVLPSLGLEAVNPVAVHTVGELPGWVTVLGAVVSTTAVGIWLWFLRQASDSLLAPMALHWATNSFGYLFAYAVWRT